MKIIEFRNGLFDTSMRIANEESISIALNCLSCIVLGTPSIYRQLSDILVQEETSGPMPCSKEKQVE
jgi:hypothetical protein